MYFAQKYVNEDSGEMFSLNPFIDIFGDKVISLQKLLFDNNTSDEHLLYTAKVQNDIMQEFGTRYDRKMIR